MARIRPATVLFLFLSAYCLAQLTCYDQTAPSMLIGQPIIPTFADCRDLLAHFPAISSPLSYANTPALHALPFLPRFSIHHKTCQFDTAWKKDGLFQGPVPMYRIAAALRAGAERITNECVALRQTGTFQGRVEHDGNGEILIRVSNADRTDLTQEWSSDRIEKQRIRLGQRPPWPPGSMDWAGLGDAFRDVSYEV